LKSTWSLGRRAGGLQDLKEKKIFAGVDEGGLCRHMSSRIFKVKSKETNRKIEVLRKIIVKMIDLEHNTGTTHVHVQ